MFTSISSWLLPALGISLVAGIIAFLIENARRKRHPVPAGLHRDVSIDHEQEFELYHNALSLCSMKSRVCMAELQVPYRSHHVDLIETGAYENIRAAFLRVNPAGSVPVLVHNGHPIYESHEQIRYAARNAPPGAPSLIPEDPDLAREMEAWIDRSSITGDPMKEGHLSAGNAVPPLTVPIFATMIERIATWRILEGLLFHFDKFRPVLFLTLKFVGAGRLHKLAPAVAAIDKGRAQMHTHLDALEAQLEASGGPWILGSQFSLADVSWLVIFERLAQVGSVDVYAAPSLRPRCAAYWEALRKRPSYAEAIEGHAHPIIEYGTERIVALKKADPALRAAIDG